MPESITEAPESSNALTAALRRVVESRWFNNLILGLILAAGVLVGVETYPSMVERHGTLLHALDAIILWAFAIEALIKMAQHGRNPQRYFYDPWNVFDFSIVVVCFLPLQGGFVAVLRLARVLRALRLVSAVPKLQLLVGALLKSIPSMFYVGVLLIILFYIYAVLGVFLWGENDPVHFRNLEVSMLSLFRIVTLEDWTDVMYIQMLGSDVYAYENTTGITPKPAASPVVGAIYFVSFVLLGTMIMMNLFIGVIINSMDEARQEQDRAERVKHLKESGQTTVSDDLATIEHMIDELRNQLHLARRRVEHEEEDA